MYYICVEWGGGQTMTQLGSKGKHRISSSLSVAWGQGNSSLTLMRLAFWPKVLLPLPFIASVYDKLWVSSYTTDLEWFHTAACHTTRVQGNELKPMTVEAASGQTKQHSHCRQLSFLLSLIDLFTFLFIFFLQEDKGVSLKLQGNDWILMESNWLTWLSQRSCGHKS